MELTVDLMKHQKASFKKGMKPCARLNAFSDLSWFNMVLKFPEIQFYDYTKGMPRIMKLAAYRDKYHNYDLTFSQSEDNEEDCLRALSMGFNVATVFRDIKKIPKTWLGRPVVAGYLHDLRFLDPKSPKGYVIALKASGSDTKKDKTGFVKL
jgi:hypothetical protein